MSESFLVQVEDAISAPLAAAPDALHRSMLSMTEALATGLLTTARSLASGDMVGVRSGHYRESLRTDIDVADGEIGITLSSKSPLAHIIEYGATIPAHDIVPSSGALMRFDGGAGEVFAKVVHDPGARLPPRPVMHTALDMMSDRIVDDMHGAVSDALGELRR